jgi:transposase InsO family protein
MQERFRFVLEAHKGEKSIARLCREFGISRPTGYKWLRRYDEEPYPEALDDQSRRPVHSPHRTDDVIEDAVVSARARYPYWGPAKLRAWLVRHWTCPTATAWPSAATIGRILKRRGLVKPPKRRRRTPPYTKPFAQVTAPNQLWCVDFKGHFAVGDGTRLYPLTVTDAFSRSVLCCVAMTHPRTSEVQEAFESLFRQYGLPAALRSDNGAPFASTGAGGLTELSAWWTALGSRHERIDPGKPQQNGQHERMHGTLKRETASPPAATLRAQQRRFDRWRKQFNEERPHQALAWKTPADLYAPSDRLLPKKLERDWFPIDCERALVDKRGFVRWKGRRVQISPALRHQLVDFRATHRRRRWMITFGPVVLGSYDERSRKRSLTKPPRAMTRARYLVSTMS